MKQQERPCSAHALRRMATAAFLATAMFTAGCASLGLAPSSPEEIVKARAAKRWESVIAGNIEAVYHYTPPSFRATNSSDMYRAKFRGAMKWTAADVKSVSCQEDACDVVVAASMKVLVGFMFGKETPATVTEKWVLEDGQWWCYEKI